MLAMRVKTLFAGFAAVLLLIVAGALAGLTQTSAQVAEAHAQRHWSDLLAELLRQSSDNLNRLARADVVSGDAKYEQEY
jgi:methyl-accepting chemotaxis protein